MPFAAVGLLVVAFMVASTLGEGSGSNPDQDDPVLQRIDAERYCKAEVSARLKSPSSAEWSGTQVTGIGPFTIEGSVDSENSFGAMLRSSFVCEVTLVADSWRLDRLSLD